MSPTGGRFADIRIGRHLRCVEKPALLDQHWVPYVGPAGLGSGPADTARKQPAPPVNGEFDRARGATTTLYSAKPHRRIPSCSFNDLCQIACPVASPDEAGLAWDAPLQPRDISMAKIPTEQTLKTHETPRGSTLTCVYISQSLFAVPVSQLVAMPNRSRTCRNGPSTHSRTLTSLSLSLFHPFPVGSTTHLPSEKRQTKKHPHKGSQTNIALMQSEGQKKRQEQQPQKKKTKGTERGPGTKQTVIRRPTPVPRAPLRIDQPLRVTLLHLSFS